MPVPTDYKVRQGQACGIDEVSIWHVCFVPVETLDSDAMAGAPQSVRCSQDQTVRSSNGGEFVHNY